MPTQDGRLSRADRTSLVAMIRRLENLLGRIVSDRNTLLPLEFHQGIRAAWEDARADLDQLREAIRSRQFDEALVSSGLSGPSLSWKIPIVRASFDAISRLTRRVRLHLTDYLRVVKRGLARVDVIFGSLIAALPVGEKVLEFKEMLEVGVSEHLEDAERSKEGDGHRSE